MVDDCNYDFLMRWKWQVNIGSKRHKYADRFEYPKNSPFGRLDGRRILMHRVIVSAPAGVQVDHIDGNGLNNLRTNLRLCTNQQNSWNSKQHKDGCSGFKGVSRSRNARGWIAQIYVGGKKIYLGSFRSKKAAALAYNEAAQKHFKEFAFLNKAA